jgi:RNA polymerase sigma factor (sigma-70 family)
MQLAVPAGDTDADLLARFARYRDSAAFELLVWRHGAMVLAACQRVLAHAEDAEDAFQAVFLVLARKARGIGRGTALPAWLHRVAVRVAVRLARSRKPGAALETEPAAAPDPDSVESAEVIRALDEEIDLLPERCRRAVVLCCLEGLTAAEAASRLGCPTGTVESRLAAARKQLRARLVQRGFTLPAGALAVLGAAALAPEAVARVARASVLFGTGTMAVASDRSVRLAKGVLTMWRVKTGAVLVVAMSAVLAAVVGAAWAAHPARGGLLPGAVALDDRPHPRAEERGAEPQADTEWSGKPVWVASTRAHLYDISPDGKQFLLSDGHEFGVFDRTTGAMVWATRNTTIHDARFSPDGKTIATGEWQNGVNLYDAATGKKAQTIIGRVPSGANVTGPTKVRPAGSPWQVCYRPDGTLVYQTTVAEGSADLSSTIYYDVVHYDPAARKELGKLSDSVIYRDSNVWLWHRGAGFFMERLQAHGTDRVTRRTVSYTDPATGKVTPTIDLHVNDTVLDLSPDGKTVLVMTAGEQPRLVDTTTGKTKSILGDHKRFVTAGAFSPDGTLIVTVTGTELSGYDRAKITGPIPEGPSEVVVWAVATGKRVARTEFPTSELDFTAVRFAPSSKFFIAVSKVGPGGKGPALYAFGAVPFTPTGGAELKFPRDVEPKHPPVVAVPAQPRDRLDRFVEELASSSKSPAEKIEAVFLAALGRFPTALEQKLLKEKYGNNPSAEALRKVLADIAVNPELGEHIKSLQKRLPPKTGTVPGFPMFGPDPTYPSVPGFSPVPPNPKKP